MRKLALAVFLLSLPAFCQPTAAPTNEPVGITRGENTEEYNVRQSFEAGYRWHAVAGWQVLAWTGAHPARGRPRGGRGVAAAQGRRLKDAVDGGTVVPGGRAPPFPLRWLNSLWMQRLRMRRR